MDIVRIRLRKPRRVLSFRSDGLLIQRDDPCVVETENGLEWGVCILPPEPCSEEMAKRATMRVVRRANASDLDVFAEIIAEEGRAREICARKIEKHNLPMKLVDAEFTYDRHKVIFHFVAENRVDFRELVRDLAHDLRQRIELRHIQVRDQAKLVGGLGTCGRQLCCSTFLEDFKPISMRMAKCQNLSLNPSKISGQCGRLLCCLAYESDQYERERKKKPPRTEDQNAPQDGAAPPNRPPERAERPAPPAPGDAATPDGPDGGDQAARKRRRKKRRKPGSDGGGREN